jgi:hypothetical protein
MIAHAKITVIKDRLHIGGDAGAAGVVVVEEYTFI